MDHLSPSQINTYLRCPRQYAYRYIDGMKEPPSLAMVEGSAYHKALERNNKERIEKDQPATIRAMVDTFRRRLAKEFKKAVQKNGRGDKIITRNARDILEQYLKVFDPEYTPEACEELVEFQVKGVGCDVIGYVDTFGFRGRNVLVDYKTSSRNVAQGRLLTDLQLAAYHIAMPKHRPCFGWINIKAKTVKFIPTRIGKKQTDRFRQIAVDVKDAIDLGAFPRVSPESPLCSERFCGFYKRCHLLNRRLK